MAIPRSHRQPLTALAVLVVLLLTAAACGADDERPGRTGIPIQEDPDVTDATGPPTDETVPGAEEVTGPEESLAIVEPEPGTEIPGNLVTLVLEVSGVEIVAADGDTSGETGHFHVFIDEEPTPVGEVIPRGPGIIHAATSPILVPGLAPGQHRFVVAVGDGTHVRLSEELTAELTVDVLGPSVMASAPETVPAGEPVEIQLEVEGDVQIRPASAGEGAHFHLFVDRDPVTPRDEPIPQEEGIIHTAESTVEIPGLDEGEHVVWVVLGDSEHVPLDPPVLARVTFGVR